MCALQLCLQCIFMIYKMQTLSHAKKRHTQVGCMQNTYLPKLNPHVRNSHTSSHWLYRKSCKKQYIKHFVSTTFIILLFLEIHTVWLEIYTIYNIHLHQKSVPLDIQMYARFNEVSCSSFTVLFIVPSLPKLYIYTINNISNAII